MAQDGTGPLPQSVATDSVLQFSSVGRTDAAVQLAVAISAATVQKGLNYVNELIFQLEKDPFKVPTEDERILIFYANIVSWTSHCLQTPRDIASFTIFHLINTEDGSESTRRLLNAYAKYVRPYWMHRGAHSLDTVVSFEEYDELTTWLFVNSAGTVNFKTRNVVGQAMTKFEKLDESNLLLSTDLQVTNVQRLIDQLQVTIPNASREALTPIARKQQNQHYFAKRNARATEIAETYGNGDDEVVDKFCEGKGMKRGVKTIKRQMSSRKIKNLVDRPRISMAAVKSKDEMAIVQVSQLVQSQKWPGLTIMNSSAYGRALIATDIFEMGDILLDYHGKEISLEEDDAIMEDPSSMRSSYIFRVARYKMSIDSYDEFCICHPRMRTFGRLINWARAGTIAANVECVPYHLESLKNYGMEKVPRGILFVANRKILPLEEIMFEYGDKACLDIFQTETTSNHGKEKKRPTTSVRQPLGKIQKLDEGGLPGIEGFSRQLNSHEY